MQGDAPGFLSAFGGFVRSCQRPRGPHLFGFLDVTFGFPQCQRWLLGSLGDMALLNSAILDSERSSSLNGAVAHTTRAENPNDETGMMNESRNPNDERA